MFNFSLFFSIKIKSSKFSILYDNFRLRFIQSLYKIEWYKVETHNLI